jgi:hypothetical protein
VSKAELRRKLREQAEENGARAGKPAVQSTLKSSTSASGWTMKQVGDLVLLVPPQSAEEEEAKLSAQLLRIQRQLERLKLELDKARRLAERRAK